MTVENRDNRRDARVEGDQRSAPTGRVGHHDLGDAAALAHRVCQLLDRVSDGCRHVADAEAPLSRALERVMREAETPTAIF